MNKQSTLYANARRQRGDHRSVTQVNQGKFGAALV